MKKIFTITETNEILQFRCLQKWEDLQADVVKVKTWYGRSYYKEIHPKKRYCDNCKRMVHLCLNNDDVLDNVTKGNCIALDTGTSKKYKKIFKWNSKITVGVPRAITLISLDKLVFYRSDGYRVLVSSRRAGSVIGEIISVNDKVSIESIEKLILELEEGKNSTCRSPSDIYDLKKCLQLAKDSDEKKLDWRFYFER